MVFFQKFWLMGIGENGRHGLIALKSAAQVTVSGQESVIILLQEIMDKLVLD